MIEDQADREKAPQCTSAAAEVIYPPVWYLDLVRARLEAVRGLLGCGAAGLWSGAAPPAAGDDAELVALAAAILGLDGLDGLPYPAKRHVLGVNDEEVRRYLADVAAQLRTESSVSARAHGHLTAPT